MNKWVILTLVIVFYTAAGIPDYRSANGLLATVKEKYKVDNPEDVFSHIFFVVRTLCQLYSFYLIICEI